LRGETHAPIRQVIRARIARHNDEKGQMLGMKRRVDLLRSAAFTAFAFGFATLPIAARAQAPAATQPAVHFMIRAFRVKGNHLIASSEVEDTVYPFMGPNRTPDDVERARAALQKVFADKGYATVAVVIPEQGVESGIIELDVQPQTVGRLAVTGVTGKNADWIRKHAPSLTPGTVPNFQQVQSDLVVLNQSPDRQVTPEVRAGAAPGTVDVTLKAQETLPLHGSLEFNNDSSPDTTAYRVLGTLREDDLWNRGDSVSLSAQTAPERSDDATVFSGNYLTRIGKVQLLGYYVWSNSDVSVVGGTDVVGKGQMAGFRLIFPISQSPHFYQSLTAGLDWKDFGENVRQGADTSTSPITYFPATLGWRGDWTYERSKSDLSFTTTFGFRGLGDGLVTFDNKRYGASPDFFVVKFDGSHTQDLWAQGAQVYVHFTGQWAPDPLVSNEEFSVGGLSTVRGYYESETLGDYGIAGQFELRSPPLLKGLGSLYELRVLAFYDEGYSGIRAALPGQASDYSLASTGGGLRVKFWNHLNGALDAGVPLRDGPNSRSGEAFFRFRVWGEF
jgi:hemolysin activation/secretion protein